MTTTQMERAKKGLDLVTGEPDKHVYEYTSVTACSLSTPGGPNADVPCLGAVQACAGNTPQEGLGPQVRLYRRELNAKGLPISADWGTSIGTTCSPELVPGEPVLGTGLILAAFHNTPFAKPAVHMQPEGNVTLVTLLTYFEVKWPTTEFKPGDTGFKPGDIDTVTLMGHQVQIRPTSESYTYRFGDGTVAGPTSSPGGRYPDGDITHTYTKAGAYNSQIDIVYGGEYRFGGSEWIPINDTVTITGSPQLITVKTARARLVIK
jgi:hypothetical protein